MSMKTTNLAFLSGLVSLTAADALPPQDVPIQCATICGPIVELSSKCTPVNSQGNSVGDSKNGTGSVWVGRRQAGTSIDTAEEEMGDCDGVEDELDRRFFTIVPAPTSFAAKYSSILNAEPDGLTLEQANTPTRITPVIIRTSNPPPPPPPPPIPPTPTSQRRQISIPTSIAAPTPSPSSTSQSQSQRQPPQSTMSLMENPANTGGTSMSGEEQCVCLNKSFDVQRVAALCTSCIIQAGDPDTNMHVVMSVCEFQELNYTARDDSIVDNIRVSATRPSAVWGHNAGVSNGGCGARGIWDVRIAMCGLIGVLLVVM